ncbi:ABC transporter ATP-binding protein [Salinigranum rubrum]|uniref:ABC transporter ATP-binding protein n=1 Tax=Salinigranum rubrum TaxID=755307 RepID=A0A2I8VKW4_9EURY|nr:ABC transporter ATP-binding protein [Salinigranum rubrum]AUV82570.1 ABC transporter ATP-binding protein [Salinigranum rubrum]
MTASERRGVRNGEWSDPSETRAVDPESAVVVDGVRKRFGSGPEAVTAVDDVSFAIERGSVVGLLGPNGAGKTTLIKCILGMVLPDEGAVSIHGHDVSAEPRRAYAHVDAMLEGARNDYWRLTVRENLRYFATISGVDPDSVTARHDRLLDQLDLADKADEPVRKLSRGMKQKVSLASVLATESDVVFLDEPTLGLDVESSLTLRRELRRIVEARDLTVVLSSHDMDVIEDVCDRVIIMSEGRVVADDTVSNLLHRSGTGTYRVTSPDLDREVIDALEARFDVTDVERRDGRTHVEVRVDSDGFYRLVDTLRENRVTIDGVTSVARDLESVFVELTDRTNGTERGGSR